MERNRDLGEEYEFGVARQKKKTESSQCIYDGRLSTPSVKFMQDTIRNCDPSSTNEKGGFGKVYFHKKKHPELGIPVAIKEVIIEENSSKLKMMSTINEKLASRTLHYAIVPLLAMTEDQEKKTFYFLSPLLENGDLFQALKNDTKRLDDNKPEEVLLTKRRRLKILLHVISALDFLHTPVKDVRGPIIHMDVKSLNIVLDADFNARLIDFGLAREMNEMQSGIPVTKTEVGGTDGYFPTRGYSYLTIYEDYHNFGVVGLECLTGLAPRDPDSKYIDLRVQHAEILTDKIQDIWCVEDDIGQEAEDILKLCRRCIDSPSKKNVTSREIIEVLKVCELFTSHEHKLIKDHLRQQQQPSWDRNSNVTNTCEMCMINPADDLLSHKPYCRCNIAVCVACMRNSYVNKIRCHSCDADIAPTIGHFWGALLIVGNDLKNSEMARNFRKDGLDVYKVIVSKCPLLMGISPEDVVVVQANEPGQKAKLKEKIYSAVAELSKKEGLKTVLLYYSGHSCEDGLLLENDLDVLTEEELTAYMRKLASSNTGRTSRSFPFENSEASAVSPKRFICFFDCCRPPHVTNLRDPHICVIQVNACRSQQESAAESSGSIFTKYLIQALTKSARGKKCIDEQCDCSPIPGEFVTVQELVGYIRKHMKRHQAKRNIEIHNAPEKSERHVTLHDEKIAYNIDFHVRLNFRIKDVDGREMFMKKIEPHFISDVNELRRILFETFMDQRFPALQFEETELLVYQECICIEIDKGPKETEELETLEKVMKAWNAKRDLAVSLRDISRIQRGMVLRLIHPDSVREKLDNTTVANIKKRDDGYTIPFADFGELKREIGRRPKGALEEFRDCLSNILNACRVEVDEERQLQIIIPKREREKEHTFVCLKVTLIKKTPAYAEEVAGTGASSPYSSVTDEETKLLLQDQIRLIDQNLLIDRRCLQMGELLGAGHFGNVFKGYLTFPDSLKGDEEVAVKTLHKNSAREIDVQAFLKEALIMKDFNHPNVLNLIGVCLGMDDMPLIVLQYMRHGDLLSYIRNEGNFAQAPTVKDLIKFGIDIAEGMSYLAELKFVHRDLACRNCMLDDKFKVKVADFGLSRDIYEKDYYASQSKKTMLPVKWMALECLEKGKYSSKSDVWSFGIVLWELMTRGVNPYPEVDNWDIVRYLQHGRRMPQPQYCPHNLYTIMRKCWHPNPKERPEFSHLAHEITEMITMSEQVMKQNQGYIHWSFAVKDNFYDTYDLRMLQMSESSESESQPTFQSSAVPYTSPLQQGGSALDNIKMLQISESSDSESEPTSLSALESFSPLRLSPNQLVSALDNIKMLQISESSDSESEPTSLSALESFSPLRLSPHQWVSGDYVLSECDVD